MSEFDIQLGFRKELRYVAPAVSVVAIPNAARRTEWEVRRAKREGLATGFPDIMALWAGGLCFIEFKTAKGRVSDNQRDWHERLTRMGHACTVARSIDDALAFLRQCGAPFLGAPA